MPPGPGSPCTDPFSTSVTSRNYKWRSISWFFFIVRLIITLSAGIFLEDMFVAVDLLFLRLVSVSTKAHSTYRRNALSETQTIVCYLRAYPQRTKANEIKICFEHQLAVAATLSGQCYFLIRRKRMCVCVCRRCLLTTPTHLSLRFYTVFSTGCPIATCLSVGMSFFSLPLTSSTMFWRSVFGL